MQATIIMEKNGLMLLTTKIKIKLKYVNDGKLKEINSYFFNDDIDQLICDEINKIVKSGYDIKLFPNKFYWSTLNITSSWKSSLVAREISNQVRSLTVKIHKAKLSTYPKKYQKEILNKLALNKLQSKWKGNFNLDSRFVDIQISNSTEFDYWLKINLARGRGESKSLLKHIKIPIYKTSHMKKLEARGFTLKTNGLKLTRNNEVILFYEKDPTINPNTAKLGIDIGINKVFVTSANEYSNPQILVELNRLKSMKHGSKRKQRKIRYIRQLIDRSVKGIDFSKTKTVVLEDLVNMKPGNRFSNRYHHWSYAYIQNRISLHAIGQDVLVRYVNPAYSSQTCSECGTRDKSSRVKEVFSCSSCGNLLDADLNAAVNLSHR